jgi:hypothetical protein
MFSFEIQPDFRSSILLFFAIFRVHDKTEQRHVGAAGIDGIENQEGVSG